MLTAVAAVRAETVVGAMGRGRRALLVEDNGEVADVTRRYLEELGFAVHTAGNAREALRLSAELEPDLVLSDVVMPGPMNGLELARRLRSHDPALAIVLASIAPQRRSGRGARAGEFGAPARRGARRDLIPRGEVALRAAIARPESRRAHASPSILRGSNLMKRVQQLRDVAAVLREFARESDPLAPGVSELAGECEALAGSIERLLSEERARGILRSE